MAAARGWYERACANETGRSWVAPILRLLRWEVASAYRWPQSRLQPLPALTHDRESVVSGFQPEFELQNMKGKRMARPHVISCSVFGGRSPVTGKRVGERHRWDGGSWGEGRCIYCGRYLEQVLEKPKADLSLDQAVAIGSAAKDLALWHPHWEPGRYGVQAGWYVKREPKGSWAVEWMVDVHGDVARFDSEDGARAAISNFCPEISKNEVI